MADAAEDAASDSAADRAANDADEDAFNPVAVPTLAPALLEGSSEWVRLTARTLYGCVDPTIRARIPIICAHAPRTNRDGRDDARRWLALDWLVRSALPHWVALNPFAGHRRAAQLRAVEPITDVATAQTARYRVTGIVRTYAQHWEQLVHPQPARLCEPAADAVLNSMCPLVASPAADAEALTALTLSVACHGAYGHADRHGVEALHAEELTVQSWAVATLARGIWLGQVAG
jgi:hypothetical protein